MKTGYNKYWSAVILFMGLAFIASPANAVGSLIVAAITQTTTFTFAMTMAAMAINIAVSLIVAKNAASGLDNALSGASQNPGNRQTMPPVTSNKLPVVYGTAWVGGYVTDMSISRDNQWIYYVISLAEASTEPSIPMIFGSIFFGGRQVNFDSTETYKVVSLTDPSTGIVDTTVNGNLYIYTYSDGINNNVNSPFVATDIMSGQEPFYIDLTYKWNTSQKMTGCAFAIVQMQYSQAANITGFQQMKFQLTNAYTAPGDCFIDYLTNPIYGAGLDLSQIDTTSMADLNTYCGQTFSYRQYNGTVNSMQRFAFNGIVDTNRSIMDNLQEMASSCDCLIKYNEITGLWGVIVQQPTYTVAMSITDSNLIGAITVSPLDIANSYNVIEVKYPDVFTQDSFNSVTYDLSQIAPVLLYPNEPTNKQSITLSLVNNNVTAQYIANRLLEAAREDLSITCKIDYTGLQLEAGDIVSVTNTNYGWTAKLFRITKVTEQFGSDGTITADLLLSEFNPQVFDDKNITEFTPAPNTGLPNALTFDVLASPIITDETTVAAVPYFYVNITAPANGLTQYAEVYYSASSAGSNLIFAGTTQIKPSGNSYAAGESMPPVILTGIPAGDWFFFYKIVNGLGTSGLSQPSSILYWRPMTFQYTNRYLMLAYANDDAGTTGFSYNPRNKLYFGIRSSDSITVSTNPANYKWYPAIPNFGTTNYLLYTNWGNRSASFAVSTADYYGGEADQGYFVSTDIDYPGSVWSGVNDPTAAGEQTYIDLDAKSGQNILTGSTTNYGSLAVQPGLDGRLQVSLNQFLNFGTDAGGAAILQKTVQPAYLTVDIYGRVVGYEYPDNFYMTIKNFTATSGQTVFTVTRDASYKINNCLVFQNGILVDTSEYTDTAGATGTVTFTSGRTLNNRITIISFRSYHTDSAGSFVIGTTYTITSLGSTTNAQWNTIAGTTGITYAVGSTFTCANIGTGMGTGEAYTIYNSFTRFTQTVTNQSIITPTTPIVSGFEYLFFNGTAMLDPDYDIDVNGKIINLPAKMTGQVTVIQWTANNLSTPNGNPYVVLGHTVSGQTSYTFGLTPYAFNLYENGVLQINGTTTPSTFTPSDYTTVSGGYTLGVSPTSNTNFLLQQSFTRTGAA